MAEKVARIKITLNDTQPPIWRRVEVPAGISLHGLHLVIQQAMGWLDGHLYEFTLGDLSIGCPDEDTPPDLVDSRTKDLASLGQAKSLLYTYDFGDGWEHSLEIEAWIPAESGARYPRCTGGARACPPEDCGGVPGYEELCAALVDPRHERHEELKEWLGDILEGRPWDPEAFDLAAINAALARLRLPEPRQPKAGKRKSRGRARGREAEDLDLDLASLPDEALKAIIAGLEAELKRRAAGK